MDPKLLPIRKIAAGLVASGLVYLARRVGLDIGDAAANEAAVAIVGFVVAYLVPDPRVRKAPVA